MAFQNVAQVSGRMHLEGLGFGVQVSFARRKHHVATGGFEPLGIGVQRARVAVKVFMRRELQAVDKNARHRDIAQRLGLPDQRDMAGVQIAHRGHKGRALEAAQLRAQIRDGVDDVHGKSP